MIGALVVTHGLSDELLAHKYIQFGEQFLK
jgi:hypothetical protein